MRTAKILPILFVLAAAPRTQEPLAVPELPGVRAAVDRIVKDLSLDGAGLVVAHRLGEVHRTVHGALAADTPIPIASASKWLAVATVLSLVDEGVLDLDQTVGRYVKELDRDDKRGLTLRTCLSCVSGLPASLGDRMRGWDMQRFAEEVGGAGLRSVPGNAFRYGGVGFQVVAVAAERAAKKTWHELFAERIAAPLGMTKTSFGTLLPPGDEAGTAALPWVAGGAVSTLDDYARFVRMLLQKGELDGKRVLSEASVAQMLRDQVPQNVVVRAVGLRADDVRYGLGTWIAKLDGGGVRASDPGAFGFTPWIDLDKNLCGVFAVQDRLGRIADGVRRLQDQVRAAAESPAVAGTTNEVKLRHGGRDRRYLLHAPEHDPSSPGLPLLVVLHGGGGSAEQVRENTGLADVGVRAGFVVVFVDGTGPLREKLLTWNSGGIDVHAATYDVDDVGFLREVVHDVMKKVPIDARRVFAAGHSNGGMMCHRLARQAADVFRGIAVVAGAMNFTSEDQRVPIAALLIHGTADRHVLYRGGEPEVSTGRAGKRVDASVQSAVDYYVARNGLLGYPVVKEEKDKAWGKLRVEDYAKPRPGHDGAVLPVRVVTLEGGGHSWPGAATKPRLVADTPFPFDASLAIVEFFAGLQPPAAAEPEAPKTGKELPSVPR
jgi:poly(3-hydroxybutyrate) depolymerase/CubicO group peptidase (beta-lactamase class C family)